MDFAHYTDHPVTLAVELVNTRGWESETEHLESGADLDEFLRTHAAGWFHDVPEPGPGDLAKVQSLRQSLRDVFAAVDAVTAATLLNEILARSGAAPRLSTHDGDPHLHFEPARRSLPDWLGVVTAMGVVTVVAEFGFDRFGVCFAGDCGDVYVDTSRNRSRLHCSSTCRTRENVAALRQRRREEP